MVALSAEKGTASAEDNLGLLLIMGDGNPAEVAEVFKWFKLAAEQGFAPAKEHLDHFTAAGKQGSLNLPKE